MRPLPEFGIVRRMRWLRIQSLGHWLGHCTSWELMHVGNPHDPYDDPRVDRVPMPPPPNVMPRRKRQAQPTMLTMRSKRSRGSWPALVVLLVLGGAGLYAANALRSSRHELDALRSELAASKARTASADKVAMTAEAALLRSEKALDTRNAELALARETARENEQAASSLEGKLQALLDDGQGTVLKGADGRLTLQLVDRVLFESGKAELSKRGRRVLARVGLALAELEDKQVWVHGHTDDVPIQKANESFPSNWELSAMRALSVVHFFEDESGIEPKRLAAAAFGSHRPVSRRRKAKNRRIEIVLFPREVKLERGARLSMASGG